MKNSTVRSFVLVFLIPAVVLTFAALFVWAGLHGLTGSWVIGFDVTDQTIISNAFRDEFGEPPSSDVDHLRFRRSAKKDMVWFTFHASPRTIEPLLKRFELADRKAFEEISRRPGFPAWIEPPATPVAFYRTYDWSPNVDASVAVVCFDQATSTLYFSRLAID